MIPETKLQVSPSPHIKDRVSVRRIMFTVVLALMPATLCGIYLFGLHALFVIVVSVSSAVVSEFLGYRVMGKKFTMDGSAVITGLLLALCLPPSVPLWIPAVGSSFAILVGKCAFGGLGQNIFNPALVGRAFLSLSWPALMTTWVSPFEGVSTATPLGTWKTGGGYASYSDLFLGRVAGCIGETSALAILIGGLLLIALKYIDWKTPVSYIGTVGLLMFLLGQDPLFHILAGGLFLGAFFMATDYVTTPLTGKGRVIFGFGAGLLVVVIRMYGGMPEGVTYSILIMNAFTPLIDRYTKPRVYGTVRKRWWERKK
ncbi:MAG: RnfABCDGE type electron transport complex subunit D [Candidatus Hadarchaeales archaeon]